MAKQPRPSPRQCATTRGCGFGEFWDDDEALRVAEAKYPNVTAVCQQLRSELREIQRQFVEKVERRLEEAVNMDHMDAMSMKPPRTTPGKQEEFASPSPRILQRFAADLNVRLPKGQYSALSITEKNRDPTDRQSKWASEWLESADSGELDIYTCLGLSNCFSWTPDTRKIMFKAIAVTFLQIVVPMCLLISEFNMGVRAGPADDDLGFRLTGFTLFGYAIFNMYLGASDECRTSLLNMMMHYRTIPMGNWFPLIAGEISNVFTAFVLCFALYSIFTTQTHPPDLILNAVAVNFLGDCDGNFVNNEMKEEAVRNFKEMTEDLFASDQDHAEDPAIETGLVRLIRRVLNLILAAGVVGCTLFLLYPTGSDETGDVIASNMSDINSTLNLSEG